MFRNIKREKNIAFGYPKAEALAQFVHSALFFSSPAAAHACSLSNAKQALRLVVRLRNALHFYPHIGIKSHVHAAAFYDFNRFPKNNREKLVVPRMCICVHL